MAYPIVWTDTTTQACINRLKEISLEVGRELSDMPADQRKARILEHLARKPAPEHLLRHEFKDYSRRTIDRLNIGAMPKWNYHRIEDGYWGCFLGDEHKLDEPFSQVDFLRSWGLLVWMTKKASNTPSRL